MTGYINYAELENNQDTFLMTIQQIKKKTVQKMTKKFKKNPKYFFKQVLSKSCNLLPMDRTFKKVRIFYITEP